jgi:Trk K+ transport system NAD-binding subunit
VILRTFVTRLGLGGAVGVAVAAAVRTLFRHAEFGPENAAQNARLVVLVAALVAYAGAEVLAAGLGIAGDLGSEAGIAAVAAGGFVLGNIELPYRDAIERFSGDVTLLVLAFVFVTLASLLSLRDLIALGLPGLLVVVLLALVVRPALVLLCTVGDRLTFRERLFVSAVGPRGIIPASVATLFALELRPEAPTAATTLVGTVFLVIFATVVFQGGLARHIAQALDVIPRRTLIVGGGRVGTALAERLVARGEEVLVLERDEGVVESLRDASFAVHHADGTQREALADAGAGNAKIVATATGSDDANLLVGQLARNTFDVDRVVARVNEPGNVPAFEDLGIETISSGMSIAWSMDNVIERPAIRRWMTELDRDGDVQEVEVTADSVVGRTVADLRGDLPDDCHLALISREGTNRLPHGDDRIERGDHLTFIGRRSPVREAIGLCTE